MSEEKQNKVWKRVGLYDLYEDASNKKTSITSSKLNIGIQIL